MREKEIPEILPEDHPERCAGVIGGSSQCRRRRVINSQFCLIHGGNAQEAINRKNDIYDFSKTKYLHTIQHLKNHSQWRSVQEEIGVLRILLQSYIDKSEDIIDLQKYSANITDLVDKLQKLISTSLKLDQHLEVLIDKERVIDMANEMVEAVRKVVTDPDDLNAIIMEFKEILLKERPKVKVNE